MLQPAQFVRTLLIVDMGTLGEVVLSLPALAAVRRHFGGATVTVLAGRAQGEVLKLAGLADRIVPLDHKGVVGVPKPVAGFHVLRALATLRSERYDLAIDLDGKTDAGLLAWASGAKQRFGPRKKGGAFDFVYTLRGPGDQPELHVADRYAEIVRALGVEVEDRTIRLPVPRAADAVIEKKLNQGGLRAGELLVGMFPGAGNPRRIWPMERFIEIGDRLARDFGAKLLVLDGPAEPGLAQRIVAGINPDRKHVRAIGLPNPPIPELLAAAARCTMFIGADTGPAHLAAAVGTPTLVLAGNDFDSRTALRGARNRVIRQFDIGSIQVGEVFDVACEMLRTSRTGALFER